MKLTEQEARKIGLDACIDKLGYEFCKKYQDNAVSSWGMGEYGMNCFVGVNVTPLKPTTEELAILTDKKDWEYYAHCVVDMEDGSVQYNQCVLP